MACSSPIYIRNKKTHEFVSVPCGHCYACLTDRREQWSDRLRFDVQYAYSRGCGSSFVTLTYNDDNYPLNGSLSRSDLSKFLRFFKRELEYHKVNLPFESALNPNRYVMHYYAVGEYGDNGRPHYHLIVVGVDSDTMQLYSRLCWRKGFNVCYSAEAGSIRYVLKYLDKQSDSDFDEYKKLGLEPPFAFISKGIGKKYLEEHKDFILENNGYRRNTSIRPMPQYYRRLLNLDSVKKPLDGKTRAMILRGDYNLYSARKALYTELSYINELRNNGKPADDSGLKYLQGLVSYLNKKQGANDEA